MAIEYLASINLNKNELQNAVIHNPGTGQQPASPTVGQIYYDVDDYQIKIYTNRNGSVDNGWESVVFEGSQDLFATGLAVVPPATGDAFLTLDQDGATEQKTTVDALATLFAGNGLTASSGIIAVGGTTNDTITFTSAETTEPLIVLKNTTNDTNGARLQFLKDKGAAAANNDIVGEIQFLGDNDAQEETNYAKIVAAAATAADTDEAGKLSFYVATSSGSTSSLTAGLILTGEENNAGEVDVTIGADSDSLTTVAGSLTVTTDITGGNDLLFTSTGAVINFNSDVLLTHSSGALTVSGGTFATAALTSTTLTTSGEVKFGTAATSGVDVTFYTAGDSAHIGLKWSAAGETEGILIGGADNHGVDFKFFGESADHYVHWDMSEDALILAAATKLYFRDAGGEYLVSNSDGHLGINAGADVDINAGDNVTIDAADLITLTTSDTGADGKISLVSGVAGAETAIHLDGNAHASSIVDIDAGVLDIDVTGIVHIDSAGLSIDNVGTAANITNTSDGDAEDFTIALAGATNSSLILSSTGTGADALQIKTTAGGIDITSSGAAADEDIDITTDASINLTATENAANAIYLRSNGGTSETIKIHADRGTAANSITILSDDGGINIDSAADKDVDIAGGQILLTSAHNTANSIYIHADAGTSETIKIHADQGAGAGSIEITSDVGSIDINSGDNITIDAADDTSITTDKLTITSPVVDFTSSDTTDPIISIINTNDDEYGSTLKFIKNTANDAAVNDIAGTISFFADDAGNNLTEYGRIRTAANAVTAGSESGKMSFGVATTGTGAYADVMTITGAASAAASTVAIAGNLTVAGTTTTVSSTTLNVGDINITLGNGAGDDTDVDGGGITLESSDSNKTFNWVDSTDAWTSNQHIDLASGKGYKINGTEVLNATTLGSNVVASSLTSVGTIATGTWEGTVIGLAYGGTGLVGAADGTIVIADGTGAPTTLDVGSSTAITILGTVATGVWNAGAVTAGGRIISSDATEATSTSDGSIQTAGGLSVTKSVVIGDDLDLLSDGAILNIGSTSKFTLTDQGANNCVMASANHRLAFGNAGEYIYGDNTDLKIISSGDLDITATLVDVTGALTVSGITTSTGRLLVDDTTDASSTTDGSLQTDGGLSVAKSAIIGDNLTLKSNACIFTIGDSQPFTITHQSSNNNAMISANHRLAFGATSRYITGDGTDINIVTGAGLLNFESSTSTLPVFQIKNTHAGATGGTLKFNKNGESVADGDVIGNIDFISEDNADLDGDGARGNEHTYGRIRGIINDMTSNQEDGALEFYVAEYDGALTKGMDIVGAGSDGNITVDISTHDGSDGGLKLGGTLVTSTAAEINLLDAAAGSSVALADGDGVIIFDASDSTANTAKKVLMSDIKTYVGGHDSYKVDLDTAETAITADSGNAKIITVVHNLGTKDVVVNIIEKSSGANVYMDVTRTTTNNIVIETSGADWPNGSSAYRLLVHAV